MLEQLKALTKESVVYGFGYVLTRVVTFLLLPYYSFRMTPAEYGEVTLYFIFIAVMQTFFVYGLDISYLRFYTLEKNNLQKREITGTVLISALSSSILLFLFITVFSETIGSLLISNPVHPELLAKMIIICGGILFFDTLTTFPFLYLRSNHKPFLFTFIKAINVALNIGLNVWFIGYLGMSVDGVLWANLIASGVTLLIFLPVVFKNTTWTFNKSVFREMLYFGLPNIPTYLFVMVIELADRKILESYRGLEEAGLYSAGYKLGMFMAVINAAFRFAWQPFFLSHAENSEAPKLFARVLTYYLLITSTLFLALTFFIYPIVETKWPFVGYLLDKRYWLGLSVFSIILLAHIFDGIYANLMVGVYLKKLTKKLPLVTGVAALITILLNLALIPKYGMIAAAWITLLAFFLEAVILWIIVKKYYAVPYEWSRMLKLTLACALLLSVAFIPVFNNLWLKTMLLLAFPVLLFLMGFFEKRELYHFKKLLFQN